MRIKPRSVPLRRDWSLAEAIRVGLAEMARKRALEKQVAALTLQVKRLKGCKCKKKSSSRLRARR